MSHYSTHAVKIHSKDLLVEKLVQIGVPRQFIEVHETPVAIRGFEGAEGPKCHVIVKAGAVAGAYWKADLGFEVGRDETRVHVDRTMNGQIGGLPMLSAINKAVQETVVAEIERYYALRGEQTVTERDADGNVYVYANAG